jgi:hypothetical protein
MAIEKKRCPSCKKLRAKPSAAVQATKYGKPHLTWKEVNGQKVCHICQDPSIKPVP